LRVMAEGYRQLHQGNVRGLGPQREIRCPHRPFPEGAPVRPKPAIAASAATTTAAAQAGSPAAPTKRVAKPAASKDDLEEWESF